MTSDARARVRSGDDAETADVAEPRDETEEFASARPAEDDGDLEHDAEPGDDEAGDGGRGSRTGARLSLPLVPVLAVLLVLLLAATGFLWFTREAPSSVQTAYYAQVLEAARSGVVDLTSFDYLTLDDDIAQINKIATGDLRSESVSRLDKSRKDITDQQAVVNTQVVGAGVTEADSSHGTVLLVIQSTQQTKASSQPTVTRYRIQVELEKSGGRWLLSGIKGV